MCKDTIVCNNLLFALAYDAVFLFDIVKIGFYNNNHLIQFSKLCYTLVAIFNILFYDN
jgi:hypothetical protein